MTNSHRGETRARAGWILHVVQNGAGEGQLAIGGTEVEGDGDEKDDEDISLVPPCETGWRSGP